VKNRVLQFPSLASRLVETQRWVVHVAPSWRLRRNQIEDGWVDVTDCIGPFCPIFTVFILGSRDILVI
jgi:hypothetical protein